MRVKVSAANDYTYSDVVALCGEPRFEDRELDTLLNPTMLIEVLSPSTQRYDRGDKFALYRRIPSLTDFLLVAQNEIRVEHHAKQNDFQWLLTEYTHREAAISLPSLGCTLRLSDI
jgi:Uma2 family endonuclease